MRLWTVALSVLAITVTASAENWPQWRGPMGTGVSPERNLPVEWSANQNIAFKAKLGGMGISNPIVWEDTVIVTSQAGVGPLQEGRHPTLARGEDAANEKPLGGKRVDDSTDVTFVVEAFHRSDGRRLWEYRVEAEGSLPLVHSKHNLASPSPVTDGERIYAWFGTGQLFALDMKGKLLWQRHLGQDSTFEIRWGHGASPTLYEDSVILLCDHLPRSYLLALDKRTGETKWIVERGTGLHSYSTPFVARGAKRTELIVNLSERVDAYEARTGEHLWFAGGTNRFPIPVPSFEDGVLYMSRGYRSGPYMAIRTGGSGDVNETHVVWRVATGAPYVSSVLHYEGLLYMVNGGGIATVVDAATGEKVWQDRIGGIYTASPVAGDGKVYLLEESGEMVVLAAGREKKVLARSSIDERTLASPAISGGQIFLRTDEHLLAVGRAESTSASYGAEIR